ncbi:MAG: isocitrate/isopropylmalate dehydrogenase family protein [Alphaproteobacteria bacterium]|nr:isocitrate/isopropylmalate dehydrogenase family protein [Alphaproteobacteria bacterium]
MSHSVTLLPGDWVGPETTAVVQEIIAAAGVDIAWETFGLEDGVLSEAALASARRTRRVLANRLRAPRVPGQLPLSIQLRKELGLWAQVRRVRNMPGVPARFSDVDLVVVRETSEDIYKGFEHQTAPGVFESVKVTTEPGCARIARYAFELARAEGREKVTVVHKSNIMKRSDGLFLRTAQAVAADYPDVACDEVIVDALCMRLVRWPQSFDVLVCGNLFGDIVADLAAGLAGGIVVGGAQNHGDGIEMFHNPHGRAPGLVGTGRANPIPNLVQGIALLRSLGEAQAATGIDRALRAALADGLHTADQGGEDGCAAVRDAILGHL